MHVVQRSRGGKGSREPGATPREPPTPGGAHHGRPTVADRGWGARSRGNATPEVVTGSGNWLRITYHVGATEI